MSIGCCPKYENIVNYVNKKLKYKMDLHSNQIVLVCQAWQIKGYHFTFIANVLRIPISDLFTVFRHGFLFQCWLHFMETFTKFFLHFESLTKKLNFQWNLISLFQLVRVIRFAIQIYNVTLSFQILNSCFFLFSLGQLKSLVQILALKLNTKIQVLTPTHHPPTQTFQHEGKVLGVWIPVCKLTSLW